MAKNEADKKYENQPSSVFSLPWTSDSLKNISPKKPASNVKPEAAKKAASQQAAPTKKEEPKKGFFGLF